MKYKILSVILISILTMFCMIPMVSADETTPRMQNSINELLNPDGGVIGVSSKGEWDDCPENSLPAIEKAANTDIDFVLTDIKKTADGVLILFSDDTTERMLASDTVYTVCETEYAVLTKYFLRNSCGGSAAETSAYKIITLEEALSASKTNDIPLILKCDASLIPDIATVLSEKEMTDSCILLTDGSKKELNLYLSECTEKPYIIGAKKGNVIFDIYSYVNSLELSGAVGVELRTGNRYGINYYYSVLEDLSEELRLIADPTVPETCGARQDSEKWWDDLISRGYSVIITDHAALFSDYKKRTDEAKDRLQELYDKYVTNHTLPVFKDENLNDIKKAYTDAVSAAETLLSDSTVAFVDINDAYSALSKTANDISKNFSALEDGSAGTTITVPRIILCVIAVIVVIIVQIYFFKRRRKEE